MPSKSESPKYVTTTKAAKLCDVSRFTIMNWVDAGKLKSGKTAGGHRRVLMRDLIRFMRENQIGEIGRDDSDTETPMCWEFKEFQISKDHNCGQCLVFREKANKCFLLVREFGPAKIQCRHDCITCEYLQAYYPKQRRMIAQLQRGAIETLRAQSSIKGSAKSAAQAKAEEDMIKKGLFASGKYLASIRSAFGGKKKN